MRAAFRIGWLAALVVGSMLSAQSPVPVGIPSGPPPGPVPVGQGYVAGPFEAGHAAPGCAAPACGPGGCGPGEVWANADLLFWWMQSSRLPPLATTSPQGTPLGTAGALSNSDTRVIFGDSGTNGEIRFGTRLNVGAWCDAEKNLGIETGMLFLSQRAKSTDLGPSGDILARPFIDPVTRRGATHVVNFPGTIDGGMQISNSSSWIAGSNFTFSHRWFDWGQGFIDLLTGYRFQWLQESLDIRESGRGIAAGFAPNDFIYLQDLFRTRTAFHGAEFGLRGEQRYGQFTFGWVGKLAVGHNWRRIELLGTTSGTNGVGETTTRSGGVQVTSLNQGVYRNREATLIPELGLNMMYDVTPNFRLRGGYTVMAWGDVVRPGMLYLGANDIRNNLTDSNGRPTSTIFRESETIWFQGINVGAEFIY